VIDRSAGDQIEFPSVQRTDDAGTGNDAVRERTATMGATILDGKKTIAKIEDGHLAMSKFY